MGPLACENILILLPLLPLKIVILQMCKIMLFLGAISISVQENIGTAKIPVTRSAGTFGYVTAKFASRNVTATPGGVDYSLTDGEVIFLDDQPLAYISIPIIDDQVKEFSEYFEITLMEATGGAVLGTNRTATVVIAKSDGPDGLISFKASHLNRIIPNPVGNRDMVFTIELTGGMDQYLTGAEVGEAFCQSCTLLKSQFKTIP